MPSTERQPEVVIHHLNNSRSERIFWALEELNIPYEVQVYLRNPIAAPKELKAVHPLGKSPVITDHGKAIAESGTIIDYLTHTYSTTNREFSLADNYWSHYSEGSLMLFLQMALVFVISGQQAPWFVKPVIQGFVNTVKSTYLVKQIQGSVDYMESELGKTPDGWFSGKSEPGAGDFMMCYPINVLVNTDRMPEIKVGPNLRKWMSAVEARPAFQRAKKRIEDEERTAKDAAKVQS
ncbi:hypothetical protein NCC49_003637 [Naganishia albida]|nr:hypothetical protein NCC49_003637 [Naganishia albida]